MRDVDHDLSRTEPHTIANGPSKKFAMRDGGMPARDNLDAISSGRRWDEPGSSMAPSQMLRFEDQVPMSWDGMAA